MIWFSNKLIYMVSLKNEQASNSAFVQTLFKTYNWIFVYTIKNFGDSMKPFDIFGCWKNKMFAIEGKYCRLTKRPTPEQTLKQLEAHQIASLHRVNRNGGFGCVLQYFQWEFIRYILTEDLKLKEVDLYPWEI